MENHGCFHCDWAPSGESFDLEQEITIACKWSKLIKKNRKKWELAQLQHRIDMALEPALQIALQLSYSNDRIPLADFVYDGRAYALRYDEQVGMWVMVCPGDRFELFEDEHLRVPLLASLKQQKTRTEGANL